MLAVGKARGVLCGLSGGCSKGDGALLGALRAAVAEFADYNLRWSSVFAGEGAEEGYGAGYGAALRA